MAAEPVQLLVVLDEDEADAALERLRGAFRVTQVAHPRLAVVETTRGAGQASLRAIPGVVEVAGADVPAELMDSLRPEEELFVMAWSRRMTEGLRKERPGEGLPWDAPGFTPPDDPRDER